MIRSMLISGPFPVPASQPWCIGVCCVAPGYITFHSRSSRDHNKYPLSIPWPREHARADLRAGIDSSMFRHHNHVHNTSRPISPDPPRTKPGTPWPSPGPGSMLEHIWGQVWTALSSGITIMSTILPDLSNRILQGPKHVHHDHPLAQGAC